MKNSKRNFSVDLILQLAVVVDDAQGFIRSGGGYYDHSTETVISDNKNTIMSYVMNLDDMPPISEQTVKRAEEIKQYFKETLIAKKFIGTINDFERSVLTAISSENLPSFAVSVIASLPNGYRVAKQREKMDEWFDERREISDFIGKVGERIKIDLYIRDVKYIASMNLYLVTAEDKSQNIVKFFFNREPDIGGIIQHKTLQITGRIKSHTVSKFSDCKETVLNYVKIQNSV